MPANGVRPNMQTFFILVKQLIMEGGSTGSQRELWKASCHRLLV